MYIFGAYFCIKKAYFPNSGSGFRDVTRQCRLEVIDKRHLDRQKKNI